MAAGTGKHMAAPPRRRRGRGIAITLTVVVAMAVAAYGYGAWYFSDHFLPGTAANGHDVSLQTEDVLAQSIEDDAQGYELTVKAGNFSITLGAEDMGLSVDAASAASAAMAQQRNLVARWPLELASGHEYEADAGVSVDDQAITQAVVAKVEEFNQSATLPQDATVGYSEDQGVYVVNPEVAGTALVPSTVVERACAAADSLSSTADCGNDALVQPALRSDDESLNVAAAKANQMLDIQVPLTEDGATKLTVGRDQILGWITFDENHNVGVDSSAVASYVRATVAPACAKSDDTHTYSVDRKALAKSLTNAVEGLQSSSIEVQLVAKEKARASDSAQSSSSQTAWNGSGRYIDVDISRQYACLFDEQGNVLWESSVVTGNTSEGRSTPSGTYAINAKTTDMTLVGADEDHDGEPDYRSHVDYWMPFIGGSYGFHDASWRSKFGGKIYKSNGSHGCVNLPHAKAQQLFSLVNVGDKVLIHQ